MTCLIHILTKYNLIQLEQECCEYCSPFFKEATHKSAATQICFPSMCVNISSTYMPFSFMKNSKSGLLDTVCYMKRLSTFLAMATIHLTTFIFFHLVVKSAGVICSSFLIPPHPQPLALWTGISYNIDCITQMFSRAFTMGIT